jgi:L,D-transpeptidase ErfK/SrfK
MRTLLLLLGISMTFVSYALTFQLPENGGTVVGKSFVVKSKPNDSIRIIGRRYDMGYEQMVAANPDLPTTSIIRTGTPVIIPAKFILPDGEKKGIVVNVSEFRLYYYPPDSGLVMTFPAGIGKDGWQTPMFKGRIIKKAVNPYWNVPVSISAYQQSKGVILPKIMPPGPKNPLGQYALYTSQSGYLLHGTNRPLGVGGRVSSGCIRLLPEDVEQLYAQVDTKTPIRVIHTPEKVGVLDGVYYLSVHPALADYDSDYTDSNSPLLTEIYRVSDGNAIDFNRVQAIVDQHDGIPQEIS